MVAVQVPGSQPVALARKMGSKEYQALMRKEKRPTTGTTNERISERILDIHSVVAMLASLKESAERHTGHKLRVASVSLHYPSAAGGYLESVITAAMASTSLASAQLKSAYPTNADMALYSLGTVNNSLPYGTSFVVEASTFGMNFDMIYVGKAGLAWERRLMNMTFNSSFTSQSNSATTQEALPLNRHDTIWQGIEDLFSRNTFQGITRGHALPSPKRPDNLVLFGDATNDATLHSALVSRFGESMTSRSLVADPVYAPALGAARLALHQMALVLMHEKELLTEEHPGLAFWMTGDYINWKSGWNDDWLCNAVNTKSHNEL
jgi:hypothetical protein